MARERRAALAAALLLAFVVVLEFLPALSQGFAGDDFELLSLARIGGFSPQALVLPHRGAFVKPVLNAAWAAGAAFFGANAGAWYTLALLVHLLNATLLGLLAYLLAAGWMPDPEAPASGPGSPRAGSGPAAENPIGPSETAASSSCAALPAPGEDGTLHAAPVSGRRALGPWRPGVLAGLVTAAVWAVHDRLSEPVFSIASLNHSITFTFYLLALLAAMRTIATRTMRVRLMTALFTLLTLFSYEVGASVLPMLVLLAVMAPVASSDAAATSLGKTPGGAPGRMPAVGDRMGLVARVRALGLPVAAAALVWAVVQGASRLAPGAVSYYAFSPAVWLENLAEIGLGFLHVPSYRVEPHPLMALPWGGLLLAGALLPRIDRIVGFGCAWALAACLPVLPIPFFSDRYHYIAFAGLAFAAGRIAALALRGLAPREARVLEPGSALGAAAASSRSRVAATPMASDTASSATPRRIVPAALVVAVGLLHIVWSIAGAREQARYYTFKSLIPQGMLEEARVADGALGGTAGVIAVVWRGTPDFFAKRLQNSEALDSRPRFSDQHPVYVRPEGILGVVYPLDLFNLAGADSGRFYRRPAPSHAAQGIAGGNIRFVPIGKLGWGGLEPGSEEHLAMRLREALLARREIPLTLPGEVDLADAVWRFAWLEPTDRAGAFEAEYGDQASAGRRPSPLPEP